MNEKEMRRAMHGSVGYQVLRAILFCVVVLLVVVVIGLAGSR